jgi:hypothetical protein
MQSVVMPYHAECHYVECRYAECRGAFSYKYEILYEIDSEANPIKKFTAVIYGL